MSPLAQSNSKNSPSVLPQAGFRVDGLGPRKIRRCTSVREAIGGNDNRSGLKNMHPTIAARTFKHSFVQLRTLSVSCRHSPKPSGWIDEPWIGNPEPHHIPDHWTPKNPQPVPAGPLPKKAPPRPTPTPPDISVKPYGRASTMSKKGLEKSLPTQSPQPASNTASRLELPRALDYP